MRITNHRIEQIINTIEELGKPKAAEQFKISLETLERYVRLYKHRSKAEKIEEEITNNPNILLLDIETAPLSAYLFGIWNQNINLEFLMGDWFMLSWVAKFLHEDKIYSDVLTPNEAISEDDKRICHSIWDLIDLADIVVAHNGKKFDIKKLNTRFIINGLLPPTPYQQIDTLEVAKRVFSFTSNKLDQINRQLGIDRKTETKAALWVGCKKGDAESLKEMVKYNENDVLILQKTYLKLRPWMYSHPNVNVYNSQMKPACHKCGSTNIEQEGEYATGVSLFATYRCVDCGSISRSRISQLGKKKRENLLTSISR